MTDTRGQADHGLAEREAAEILRRIETGDLAPGDPIPTIAAMVERGVTVTTARAARQLLREWGLVSGGRGAPLRVRRPHRPIVHSNTRHQLEKDRILLSDDERRTWGATEYELDLPIGDTDLVTRYQVTEASADLAGLLQMRPGEPLLRRQYEMRDRETGYLVAASYSYLPVALVDGNPRLLDEAEEPWPGGTMHQLWTVGIELKRVIERTGARPPIAEERDAWGMEPGDVLLTVRRLSVDTADRVVELSDAMYPASRTVLEWVTDLRSVAKPEEQE